MINSLIAVDPGDAHVGVAFFNREIDGWECSAVEEMTPNEFNDDFAESLLHNDIECIVYERFRLYEDKSGEQVGSEFLTSQMIGVIKYLVRIRNNHADYHDNEPNPDCAAAGQFCAKLPPKPVILVGQVADIKKPAAGILRHKGIKSIAGKKRAGRHCKDAELHGWYYILHTLKDE